MNANSPDLISPLPAPAGLAELQMTFGQAIATPLIFENECGDYSMDSEQYPPAIVALMVPQPERNLSGSDRLASYNRQYWFRLMTVMQEEYPLLADLLGETNFNQMVSAYLTRYPPYHPSLRYLSDRLGRFLSEDQPWNKALYRQAAALEFRFIDAFDAADRPPLGPEHLNASDDFLSQPLCFQPHVFFFAESWNLMACLLKLKRGDERALVPEPARGFWSIFRQRGQIITHELGPLQYKLLAYLNQGLVMPQAIAATCDGLDEEQALFLSNHIGAWFAQWSGLGWFALP